MKDYINIGSVPSGETPEQVGTKGYDPINARKECQLYRDQLRRQFGPEPEGATLQIKVFNHEFGQYMEVICHYDTDMPNSVNYAMQCEGEAWPEWDSIAKKQLKWRS